MNTSLLIQTLKGQRTKRPPVWFMRQAGRCLPSYNRLRERYSFMELMEDPGLASDVTLLPIHELGVDAAILFSDILVIPQALGMELTFTGQGPRFANPLKDSKSPMDEIHPHPDRLSHVYAAIKQIIQKKPADIPLIGFCGGPLTVFLYMVQGLGSNHKFPDAVKMIKNNPDNTHLLLEAITEISIDYGLKQIDSGVEAFQLFETWAGIIPSDLYFKLIMPYSERILKAIRDRGIPVIFFPRLIGDSIKKITTETADGISIDQEMSLAEVRQSADPKIILQGNLNPELLFKPWNEIEARLKEFGNYGRNDYRWIFNMGHGVLPETSSEKLKRVVDWVKSYDWRR